MFSIVVPTMWRYEPFLNFVSDLIKLPSVGEVVIINNAVGHTPNHAVLSDPKVKLHNFNQNIFVNPAWNYGVAVSEHDQICIMNDDIIFDIKLFPLLDDLVTSGRCISVCPEHDSSRVITGDPRITPYYENMPMYHFGALMFVNKNDWIDIPSGLDISHGDNWIWESMICRFDQNYVIENLFYYTPGSVTNNTIPNDLDKEYRIFAATFRKTFKKRQGCIGKCRNNCPSKNITS